jgi:hypothetical protein
MEQSILETQGTENQSLSEFDRLLSVILEEGWSCQCPQRDTCGNEDTTWCRHITKEGSRGGIPEYKDLSLAPCLYRERPGCCWVLARVEELAEGYLTSLGVDRPPVPSELIAAFDKDRPIETYLVPLRSYHGAVWLLDNEWIVHLNSLDSPNERRQTLFHEAFHIVCRSANPAFKKVDMGYKPFRDILADHFATCILMPKEWIREHTITMQDIKKMAGVFEVPLPAIKHRLDQLGLQAGNQR